jgi:hypothetical protein
MHTVAKLFQGLIISIAPLFVFAKTIEIGPSNRDLNFGVVANNRIYQIYRSGKLGKSGLEKLKKELQNKKLPFPKTIVHMNKTGYAFPFHFAIEEYEQSLKRKYGYFTFYHSYGDGIRTYIDGYNPLKPKDDIDNRFFLGIKARKYFKLDRTNGIDGGISNVLAVLAIILAPTNQPVLFHCHGGLHRTGQIGMLLRYMQGGKWLEKSGHKYCGMELNWAEYEYYTFNKILFRKQNIEFVREFSRDSRFLRVKQIFANGLRSK